MTDLRQPRRVLLLLALVALLRVPWLVHATWGDERFTVWAVGGTLSQAVTRTTDDVHPPLHSIVVWGWRKAGEGLGLLDRGLAAVDPYPDAPRAVVLWYRLANVFFFLPGALVAYALARALFPGRADWATALVVLVAVLPFGGYWDMTARPYPMMSLFLHTALWSLVAHATGRAQRGMGWLALGLAAGAAACYTHYFSFAYLGVYGMALWLLPGPRRRVLEAACTAWGAPAAVVLASLAWFPSVGEQLVRNVARGAPDGGASAGQVAFGLAKGLAATASTPGAFLLETHPGAEAGYLAFVALLVPLAAAAALGLTATLIRVVEDRRGATAPRARAIGFLWVAAFGPVLLLDAFVCGLDVMPRMLRHYHPSYIPYLLLVVAGWDRILAALRSAREERSRLPARRTPAPM